MIHRFVDLFEEVIARNIIWNVRRETGGTNRTFALAGGPPPTPPLADYLEVPFAASLDLDKPDLSPDLVHYAFVSIVGSGSKANVVVTTADDASSLVTVAQNPSGAAANPNGGTDIVGWSPDSSTLYYRGINNNTNRDSEIWEVAPDGTGLNLIWTSSAIDGVAWGVLPRVAPDGSMFAWWNDFDQNPNDGLHVLNIDGTGLARRYTALGEGDFLGWSRDSEWLLFVDHQFGVFSRLYKIRPDGTDQSALIDTTYLAADFPFLGVGQHSIWLPDSSGIVCAQNDGTGDYEIGVLLADGSETFTPWSPQRLIDPSSLIGFFSVFGPVCSVDNRAYWLEGGGAADTSKVVSAELDGSDYRVDDDMTDSTTTPQHDDFVFKGFHKRTS